MTDFDETRGPHEPSPPVRESAGDGEVFEPTEHLDEDACTDIVAGLVARPYFERALGHASKCSACEMRLLAAGGDLESIRTRPVPAGWGTATLSDPARSGSELENRRRSPGIRRLRVAIPLALAAALLVVVFRTLPRGEFISRDHTYWITTTDDLLSLRGSPSWEADSAFWNGLSAYQAHDTERAREMLQRSKAGGGLEDLRRLYLASTLVNAGSGKDALKMLDDLAIDDLPMPWREDAYWMKFQALTLLHRSGEAGELLDRMVSWPGRVGDMARKVRSSPQAH